MCARSHKRMDGSTKCHLLQSDTLSEECVIEIYKERAMKQYIYNTKSQHWCCSSLMVNSYATTLCAFSAGFYFKFDSCTRALKALLLHHN